MHSENLKISALRKNFRSRLRSRRRKPFIKRFSAKNTKIDNRFTRLNTLQLNHPLKSLAARGNLLTDRLGNHSGSHRSYNVRKGAGTRGNRSTSLVSIKNQYS